MNMQVVQMLLLVVLLLFGDSAFSQATDPSSPSRTSGRSRGGDLLQSSLPNAQAPDFNVALLQAAGAGAPVATRPWVAPVVTRRLSDSGSSTTAHLEFKVSRGDRVVAPMGGKVLRIGSVGGTIALLLDHGSGFFSNLSGPMESLVAEGSMVVGDQLIGQIIPGSRPQNELNWSVVYAPHSKALTSQDSIAQRWANIDSSGVAVDTVALLGLAMMTVEVNPAPSGRQFEIQLNDQALDTLSANRPPIRLLTEPRVTRVTAREGFVFKTVLARDSANLEPGERVVFTLATQTAYQAQPRQVHIADQMILSHEKSSEMMRTAAALVGQASSGKLPANTTAPIAPIAPVAPTAQNVPTTPAAGAAITGNASTLTAVSAQAVVTPPASPPPVIATPPATVPAPTALRPAVLSTPIPSAPPSPPLANRKALVIGNDRYTAVTPLLNARADAQAIGRTLASLGYRVTVRLDLDERQMKASLREFRTSLEGGDEVVFFFAGHGVQLGATNYLLPTDIRGESEEQVRDDAMPLQRILDDLADRRVKLTLAIIDACRDNPFPRTGRAIGSRGRGLAPTSAATGQMVVYSAGAGQQALDRLGPSDTEPHGLFTRMLLREMLTPGMRVDSVIREVRKRVVEAAQTIGHEQVPAVYDQVVGDFYFVR